MNQYYKKTFIKYELADTIEINRHCEANLVSCHDLLYLEKLFRSSHNAKIKENALLIQENIENEERIADENEKARIGKAFQTFFQGLGRDTSSVKTKCTSTKYGGSVETNCESK